MYFNAWYELDRDRDTDNGLKRIKRSEIVAYARDCGFDPVQADNLLVFVRAMDNAYLAFIRARTPKQPAGAAPGAPRGRGRR